MFSPVPYLRINERQQALNNVLFTGGWVAVVNPIFVDVLGSRSIPLQARFDTKKNSLDLFIEFNSEKLSAKYFT
jgi:hypothetical protein